MRNARDKSITPNHPLSPFQERRHDQNGQRVQYDLLVIVYNFLHYCFVVPFKFKWDPNQQKYHLQTYTLQKVICAISHVIVCGTCIYFCFYLMYFPDELEDKVVIVFTYGILSTIATLFVVVLSIVPMWLKREQYLQIIELTQHSRASWTTSGTCIAGLYNLLGFSLLLQGILAWGVADAYTPYSGMDLNSNGTITFFNQVLETTIWKSITEVLLGILNAHLAIVYGAIPWVFIILAVVLMQLGQELDEHLQKLTLEPNEIDKGINMCRKLKEKTKLIQELYGNQILSYYFLAICYCALAPHTLLYLSGNGGEQGALLCFILTGVMWLILAAEFHHKTQEVIARWIFQSTHFPLNPTSRLRLMTLSKEMETDPIAISCKYFKVTYDFAAKMGSLIVTYAVIVFQMYFNVENK